MAEDFTYCQIVVDKTGKAVDFIYLYINEAFKKDTGLHNIIGKKATEVVPNITETNPELFEIYGQVSLSGKPKKFETYIGILKKYYKVSVYSTKKGYFASVFEDITDRKQMEIELDHERKKWKGIIDGIADEVWVSDKNGEMSLMNISSSTLMGLEEFHNQTVDQIYKKVDILNPDGKLRPKQHAPLLISLKGRVVRGEEIMRHRKTGVVRYREFSSAPIRDSRGSITGAVAVVRDITNGKLLEEKNKLLASIVETSYDGIIATSLDKAVTIWNSGAEKMYGFKNSEMIGKSLFAIVPPGYESEILNITQKIKKGKSVVHLETKRKRKDGKIIDIILTVSPIYNNRGEVVGSSSISKDITKIKQLERLKDEFLGVASHELKTPLASMKLYSEIARRIIKERGDEQLYKLFFVVDKQINRLNRLVTDLLDVTKINETTLELQKHEFDLKHLVDEVIGYMQETTSHKITNKLLKTINILGDRNRIEQVLVNLIANAIKYSPEANNVVVGVNKTKTDVIVWVQDFGIGIAKNRQTKLFSKFYRISLTQKERYPGIGLGLYISSEIVKKHGGKIWVESKKGKGSTFYFSLPRTRGSK